ncbi:hypothetical protein NQT62_04955 [Limnobacter humi]|uniref:Uncharacterized protein n=1 Tax=Limnobacter humi TaxID=1778671 RepID=A0ABT1WE39_9BURK|nr:hypothetical protein [Limnobacter humi]MCQ8895788.1 hypothetical protein [Limnobacter humi]
MKQFDRIRSSFEYLLPLLHSEGECYLAQKIREGCAVIDDIEQGVVSEEKGLRLLKEIHKTMYWAHGGLADFHVWRESAEERAHVNQEIAKRVDFIWGELREN